MATQRVQVTDTYQGLSFQHPAKARPGSSNLILNGRPDIALGMTKRNSTSFVARVNIADDSAFFHLHNLIYVVIIEDQSLIMRNITTGEEKTVINEVGDLLNRGQRIGDPAGPEPVPEGIHLGANRRA